MEDINMQKEQIFNEIKRSMEPVLNTSQMSQLIQVLSTVFKDIDFVSTNNALSTELLNNHKIINCFFACKRIDGISKQSEIAYKFTIRKFLDYVNWMPLEKVDTNIIRLYLLHCEQIGNAKTTCDNNRRNLNAFFQWLEDEDYIAKNPCRKIKRIKEPDHIKRHFTDMEMEMLRDSCKNKRELALIDLLISTGIRVGEVPTIKVNEINWKDNSIIVTGKGDKQRYCYLTVKAQKHIRDYLQEREEKGIESDYLFCRSKYPYTKIGKASIGKTVKQIGERCGLDDIHIHGIRAFFATNLSDQGVASQTIQALMGHESFSTTVRYYCRPNQQNAKNAVLLCGK